MKRILALILSFALLGMLAVATVSAANDNKIDCRELEEFGQKHFYLGAVPEKSPNVEDATVSENEYAVSYEYKNGDKCVVLDTRDEGATIIDNEWVKIYIGYDQRNLYLAAQTKDPNYIQGSDGVSFNLSFKDRGHPLDSISRMCFDLYQHRDAVEDDTSTFNTKCRFLVKDDNGAWISQPSVDGIEYITDISGRYDEKTQVFTVELELYLGFLLEYWENDLPLEELRLSIMPFVWMYGESSKGAGDVIRQGILWSYLPKSELGDTNALLKSQYSYEAAFHPHIVHFCEDPRYTTATQIPTTEVTTMVPTTVLTTTEAPATTESTITQQTTADVTTVADGSGCGGAITISAFVTLTSALTVCAVGQRKKER